MTKYEEEKEQNFIAYKKLRIATRYVLRRSRKMGRTILHTETHCK